MDKKKQIEVLKHKIRAVGRMARLWDIRKKNTTLILNLKEMCPDGKIPAGTLIKGKEGITDKLKAFLLMKNLDRENEKWHGPRKYTLDQLSNTAKMEKDEFSEGYQHLKDSQMNNARRTTLPAKTNKSLLNPSASS